MWDNPPPEVSALQQMLILSPTWAALAGSAKTSSIHYPSLASGDSASPDPEPSIVLDPNSDEHKIAAPSIILPQGTITAILRQKKVNAAAIETTARAIAYDVSIQSSGLPISGIRVGMASGPDPASLAGQAYSDANTLGWVVATRSIPIIFTYGLG